MSIKAVQEGQVFKGGKFPEKHFIVGNVYHYTLNLELLILLFWKRMSCLPFLILFRLK